ncbi:hypothetical protein AOCH_007408 [Aspergillus ochraceoroseus]|uniref:Copper-fist domain-containing protein n=1 Tax=Aspergillus ochraceoroseus TaxID=138278 RepID=A0A0F8UG51_9EURO|nr:hypothetical protein AOCH_007408 [Aspergillus ochraceoroseus]
MLIDGEKWACEACVRGHRVSSCHHSDRPLTHINKKGRPVSQCPHCRGLRKSRTTHTKCECGDKKKNSHKNDLDPNAADKRDLKQDSRPRCGCTHGQRCTCALKKEPHLDPVPETGLPPPPTALLSDQAKKPQLTSTTSEGALTIFRDGHHKPAHKHNDMAHKCGLPYTIPRSHTVHGTSDVARRSMDHLPYMGESLANQPLPEPPRTFGLHRRVKSEHGSPENVPVAPAGDVPTSVPPLDLSPLFSQSQPMEEPTGAGVPEPISLSMGKTALAQIVTSVPPLDVSSFSSFATMNTSPVHGMPYPDTAPPVDWSSFPLYSDLAPTSTQPPSYASFDYNSMGPGFPAPSSSGDISEVEDFAPLPNMGTTGNDLHDMHSVSEGSDIDHYRVSSASSFIGLPQAQLLSSNNLESINIDDFLKSANESTAVLEHQLQVSMGMESKPLPSQDAYAMPDPQVFKAMTSPSTSLSITTSATDPIWPTTLFDPNTAPLDDTNTFFAPPWVQ